MPPPTAKKKQKARRKKRGKKGRKLTPSSRDIPVLTVNKDFLGLVTSSKRIVYLIRGNKAQPYPWNRRSRILYIGRTGRTKGERPIESSLKRAPVILNRRGVRSLEIVHLSVPPVSGIRKGGIAKKLENACLLLFREHFGKWPEENRRGPRDWTDEKDYFNLQRIKQILINLSA